MIVEEMKLNDSKPTLAVDFINIDSKDILSYDFFNELLELCKTVVPIIYTHRDDVINTESVIMFIPYTAIEKVEEITPTWWEYYIYWITTKTKYTLNATAVSIMAGRMLQWYRYLNKVPYVVIFGIEYGKPRGMVTLNDIRSAFYSNGLSEDHIYFINNAQTKEDKLEINKMISNIEKEIHQ